MERLGYYAKCNVTGNLLNFSWKDDKFLIKTKAGWVDANPKDYEILEVGNFTADSDELETHLKRFGKMARSENNVPLIRLVKDYQENLEL